MGGLLNNESTVFDHPIKLEDIEAISPPVAAKNSANALPLSDLLRLLAGASYPIYAAAII
jgi:hypothetical protein